MATIPSQDEIHPHGTMGGGSIIQRYPVVTQQEIHIYVDTAGGTGADITGGVIVCDCWYA